MPGNFATQFTGRTQGKFLGDDEQGYSRCTTLRHDVGTAQPGGSGPPSGTSPLDPRGAPGWSIGASPPGQLTIVKEWNAASAQLQQALNVGEELTVFMGWSRLLPGEPKSSTYYHMVELTKAKIIRILSRSDPGADVFHTVDVEEITIAYEQSKIWARNDLDPAIRLATAPTADVAPAIGARAAAPEPSPEPAPSYSRIAVRAAGQQVSGDRVRVSS